MTAVAVEITTGLETPAPEPAGVLIVDDVETLATGAAPGCGEDNPYQ